ncbi:MAG: class I SAM-dependent methyltransferase [Flavobacteriales bacterium]|nr:class I SAM-dependent methyltransferase [Flavobacteriales bacterium]
MTDFLQRTRSYIDHLVRARARHGVHSPFVYELIESVFRPRPVDEAFAAIEQFRSDLLRSDHTIQVIDLGAGSARSNGPTRRVADQARSALKPPHQARLLYKLARHLDARQVLELGTSFGLTTLYLAYGARNGQVHTIEGCPETLSIAKKNFEILPQPRIHATLGSFEDRLPDVLRRMERLDLAFIDGHHEEEATLRYFELCLSKAHNDTVLVLDDIHWSCGMESAWERVKDHSAVTVTIDLYDMGLVFLRSEQAKEHFRLRY